MKMQSVTPLRLWVTFVFSCTVVGCAAQPRCPVLEVMNARYVGRYLGVENNLTPSDFARDLYCANAFKSANYPKGYVTVYGSSRIKEHNDQGTSQMNAANDLLYSQIRAFAMHWTQRYGTSYPIMTGAGPGLMEAANRGASVEGKSIGYTTYYDKNPKADSTRPYGGDPLLAYDKQYISDGLIFSSVAMREDAMILHSAAIIIAPGGTGTEWETFQILEMIKSKQLVQVPIYIVGNREVYWKSLDDRLRDMVAHHTVRSDEVIPYIEYVDNAEDVVGKLGLRLGLN